MREQDFMIFSDMELMDADAVDYLSAKAAGVKNWLMVQSKSDSVLHLNSGKRRHGCGRNYWIRLCLLRREVSSKGIRVFLGFYEKRNRRTLLENVCELELKRTLCSCAEGCATGDLQNCQFEPGGMVFFNIEDLLECGDFDDACPIVSPVPTHPILQQECLF